MAKRPKHIPPKPKAATPHQPISEGVRFAPIVVGLVLLGSTVLLCDAYSPGSAAAERWPWWVDRALAAPIELTSPSDVRPYVLPVGLVLLLLLAALKRGLTHTDAVKPLRGWWFEIVAAATALWACASAGSNDNWERSTGWIFAFACGATWAAMLARRCTAGCVSWSLAAGGVVAMFGAILSLLHRGVLGEPFFQLPVGPITLTASLGAMWSAIALAWLVVALFHPSAASPSSKEGRDSAGQRHSHSIPSLILALLAAIVSLTLLLAAGRRGAALGLLAGLGVVIGAECWARFSSPKARAILAAMALAALAAVVGYVRLQTQSTERVVSGPLKIRAIYWDKMLELIPRSLVMGIGPDQFVVKMSTALARRRAEEPRIVHGAVDYEAHNEWLQAIFELGVPGGLMYLALPAGVLILAWRRWRKAEGRRRLVLPALMAGLVTVFVSEASSINLRHPILQGWYWTLLGLTLAASRDDRESPSRPSPARSALLRATSILAAAGILFVVAVDLRAVTHHAKGRSLLGRDDEAASGELEQATGRLGAAQWLATRSDLATAQSNVLYRYRLPLTTQPAVSSELDVLMRNNWGTKAVGTWRRILESCPGYSDTGFRLAEAQTNAGDIPGAIVTLDLYLNDTNPYDVQANVLLASIAHRPPMENLEAVCRGLRSGALNKWLGYHAVRALGTMEAMNQWPARVEEAKKDLARPTETDWKNPLAPEVLRLEAFRLASTKEFAEAAVAQRLAADAYRRLDASRSPVTRIMPAMADAWYLAARFTFDADPNQCDAAYKMMMEAERSVQLGVAGDPDEADKKTDLGQVVLASRTEEMRQLMRFSAKMHLAAQRDLRPVINRITWSMAQPAPSPSAIDAELGQIAAELVKSYADLPMDKRPAEFPRIVDVARRYLPH